MLSTYVLHPPRNIGHLDDVSAARVPEYSDTGNTARREAEERTAGQMETTSGNRNNPQLILIDATELDDEQFNDLITSIDPRRSIMPILCGLVVLLALAMIF
jgi:hypothetical protein